MTILGHYLHSSEDAVAATYLNVARLTSLPVCIKHLRDSVPLKLPVRTRSKKHGKCLAENTARDTRSNRAALHDVDDYAELA